MPAERSYRGGRRPGVRMVAVDLTVEGGTRLAGLPGLTPRPEGVDVAGSHTADLVVVSATTPLS